MTQPYTSPETTVIRLNTEEILYRASIQVGDDDTGDLPIDAKSMFWEDDLTVDDVWPENDIW